MLESAQAGGLRTDLSKALIPLDEVISGGPPPDGIPAIDRPSFVQPAAAWLKPEEPVLALEVNGDARAYPGGKVLSRETGHSRSYGRNPYESYDRPDSVPFLLRGDPDRRRAPKERVVGVVVAGAARAYPWPVLARQGVLHDALGGQPLVIFHRPGALSALDDSQMERSRAIGASGVFSPTVGSKTLSFEATAEGFRDRQTGTLWNLLGHAVQGPLAGKRLRPVPHVDAFWFAWAAFHPTTTIYGAP